MDFKHAYLRLKEIHDLLQKDELIEIEKITELQKEAKECYEYCEKVLAGVQDKE